MQAGNIWFFQKFLDILSLPSYLKPLLCFIQLGGFLMARGRVKRFDEKKGYGFIELEEGGPDVFVHYSDIVGEGFRTLTPGELVEFDLVEGEKGPKALNVRRIEE